MKTASQMRENYLSTLAMTNPQLDKLMAEIEKVSIYQKFLEKPGIELSKATVTELRKAGFEVIEHGYRNEREDSYFPNVVSWK